MRETLCEFQTRIRTVYCKQKQCIYLCPREKFFSSQLYKYASSVRYGTVRLFRYKNQRKNLENVFFAVSRRVIS